ncbi:MAG: NUDIX domain-containing protein [Candidatus Nomurabacteria bacterium]|nr:NUDIX domain-containing protein [Candidatus Nomurabacteria bacterium]
MLQINIGINIIIVRDNKLLLGKRKGAFGAGDWGLPGGHLEQNEKLQDAAARELFEETGMKADKFIFENLVNQPRIENHYMQIGFIAEGVKGEPQLLEPDRCEEWRWFDLENLPENVFRSHRDQINLFKKRENFTE